MSPSSGRPGTYLSTGWRIVGAAADRVAERTETVMDDRLRAGTLEDTLFALDCTVPALDEGRASVERVLDAVTEEIRLSWADCPRLLRDEDHKRSPSRFGGLWTAHSIEPGKQWVGEVIWRSVHPLVAGSAITTRLVLQERQNFLRIGVRVTSDDGVASVRGDVGAGQAQPKFLRSLRSKLAFSWQGGPFKPYFIGS